jgi:hypothetical protein
VKIFEKDSELLNRLINFYDDINEQIENKEILYDDVSFQEMIKRRELVKNYIVNYATSFLNNILSLENVDIQDIKDLITAGRSI